MATAIRGRLPGRHKVAGQAVTAAGGSTGRSNSRDPEPLDSSQRFAPPNVPSAAVESRRAVREFRAAWKSILSLLSPGATPDGDRDRTDGRHDADHPRRGPYKWTQR